jgi:hypothetical protein
MKVEFTCASVGEKAQTIKTSQFKGIKFKKGQNFTITLVNGTKLRAYVNRADLSTLYIKAIDFPANLKRAQIGKPVSRLIKSIKFENGKSATARVTRNGRTLYISASEFPSGLKRAEVGSPVLRKIKSIKKVK